MRAYLRALALSWVVGATLGCGSSDSQANVNARLSWVFNHADWTQDGAAADLRGCDNSPSGAAPGAGYPPVATVHVLIEDPAGQVQPFDQTVDCARGVGG